MPLWKRLWLLFTIIWLVVAGLNVMSILAFGEEPEKAVRPAIFAIVVPAVAYLLAWAWAWWREKK